MIEKIDEWYNGILLALIVIIQFLLAAGLFGDFKIQNLYEDFFTAVYTMFTITANVMATIIGADAGIEVGLKSGEFEKANDINNGLNNRIQPLRREFSLYIRTLNREIIAETKENFLIDKGKIDESELTDVEMKEFKKLKFKTYNPSNMTTPLYVENANRGAKINVGANFDAKEYKRKGAFKKAFGGILLAFLTVDIAFSFTNLGQTMAKTAVVLTGIGLTYLIYKRPVVQILKRKLPNQVEIKASLWEGFQPRKSEFQEKLEVLDKKREQSSAKFLPYSE